MRVWRVRAVARGPIDLPIRRVRHQPLNPQNEDLMDVHVDTADEVITCRPVGELDAASVADFRAALAGLANGSNLIIDLGGVPFMDSAGLGALIGGIRRTREAGGEVALVCSRPTLLRLLETTGFDRIVAVVGDTDAALGSFTASQ